MIATGTRKQGRLAGGAVTPSTYAPKGSGVFGSHRAVYSTAPAGPRPGGLIDKRQQIDPASTTFGHPFDGGGYRSTATLKKVEPKIFSPSSATGLNPLTQHVPEIGPHERGTFFLRGKQQPIVRTVGGARMSGLKSNTPFHPQGKTYAPQPKPTSAPDTAKIINKSRTPSFQSHGNLWGSGNHSFIKGRVNTISGTVGTGRWNTVKVGAAG